MNYFDRIECHVVEGSAQTMVTFSISRRAEYISEIDSVACADCNASSAVFLLSEMRPLQRSFEEEGSDQIKAGVAVVSWGILFQQGALFSSLTARQNVQFPLRENLVISEELLDEIANAKLEMVGLSVEDGDKFPSQLSGGMTKRVALARALALDPGILFLDEPTSGLDPIAAGDFDTLIKTLQTTLGLTVFMVTHDLASLNTVCDRVAALADGKVVAIGSMKSLLQSEHPWVRAYFHGKRSQMFQPQKTMKA